MGKKKKFHTKTFIKRHKFLKKIRKYIKKCKFEKKRRKFVIKKEENWLKIFGKKKQETLLKERKKIDK